MLVEPKYGGNVGAVARAMMNFGFVQLYLVKPCVFDDECYTRAMHARKILECASVFSTFDEAIKQLDYLVATSSIESETDKKHLRNAIILQEFVDKIFEVEGKIGVVFGREDYGLFNDEISKCDLLVKIPTSNTYQSLNLSHAVCLVLYALYVEKTDLHRKKRPLGSVEKDKMLEFFAILLDEINFPDHKKENTKIMFRRIMGRAMPSKWEFHRLMGVFSKTLESLKR